MSKRKLAAASSASTIEPVAMATEQDRHAFATKLRDFHYARKTPFLHAPVVLGRRVDFLRLYNTVASLGGYRRVNDAEDWYRVLESMGLYKYCANAEMAIRQVYLRYLEPFERHQQHHQHEPDKDLSGFVRPAYDEDSNDAESSMSMSMSSRVKRSQSFASETSNAAAVAAAAAAGTAVPGELACPAVYNVQSHILAAHMREQWGLSCDLVDSTELASMEKALLCGLPNEVDFAINACLLMSYQPGGFQLLSNPRILELLAAHAGVFDSGPRSYFPLMQEWLSQNKTNMLRFWYESVWDSEFRNLLSPTWLSHDQSDSDAVENVDIPDAEPVWRLMNLTADLGLRDLAGQRVVLIVTALRNLVLEDRPNAVALTRSPPALRLLLLCAASRHSTLQHLALDSLASLPIVLHSARLATAMQLLLRRCLGSQDRQLIVRGLELLCCLASQPDNWQRLQSDVDLLPADLADNLAAWLLLKDLQLMLAALEAANRLSGVGGDCSTRLCSPSPELLRVLLSLLTFEASQVGSAGIVGIKIFQGPGAAAGSTPAASAAAAAAASAAATAAAAVGAPNDCGMPPPPPPPPQQQQQQQQVALVRQSQQQSNHIQAQQPPNLRDYIVWWLRSRRVTPGPHRLSLLHADCGRAFAAQFNGAPFLTLADFCSLLGDLGFSAAPELQNGGLSIVQQPAAPTMDNDNSKLVLEEASTPTKKVLTEKQDQRQKQTEQQQRQPRRRNSCSSVSSSDDSSSAAAAGGRLMTASEPQATGSNSSSDPASTAVADSAASPSAAADSPAVLGHEAVIERVLNHLRPGEAAAKAKQQQQRQQVLVNGHHPSLPNGASVSILPNGHDSQPKPTSQQPQQQQQQQLIRIVGPPSTPQQPPLGLLCEWDGCWYCGDTPARVLHHVYTRHLRDSGQSSGQSYQCRCLWRGCDPTPRGAYSLLAHVQESHCSERALQASLQRRRAVALSPSSSSASIANEGKNANQPAMLRLPEDAARHAIHRLAAREVVANAAAAAAAAAASSPSGSSVSSREGPVTKHIRLTAALALRNLLRHAQPARLFVSGYSDYLAEICLSGSEAALIVSQCVCDLA
ncbi:hypothetical protein BOX15_Mlig013152g1 [Macrostomum lignano]|uniref:ARID domain-containing protein n=3 Tax=Macrostomum lignano TaxID=282301 RepID=A0A267E574_9PLAT|nr:hypothetical protein BOX15_Mlig013152g1 [Macrostomum lignano]